MIVSLRHVVINKKKDEFGCQNPAEDGFLMNRFRFAVAVLLIACFTSGCSLVKLREDVQFSKDSSLLSGEIFSRSPSKNPIVVAAYSRQAGKVSIEDYAKLSEPGPYELLVREGEYGIFAFEDANGNMVCDEGEWTGHYGKPDMLSPQPGGIQWGLDLEMSNEPEPNSLSWAKSLAIRTDGWKKPCTSAGAIADMNDPAFSAEQGTKGFWAPLDSFKLTGCNIYFLEPYDRKKIPVLFVHGAAGSPQDWRYFIDNIDRSRYQPWIFHYPSGARLKTISFFMRKKLYDLHRDYNFETLFVVAHSMGGLVSRSALIENDLHNTSVKLFISISTPWGGEQRAKTGVEMSPFVIPSWKDVEPDSEFIREIFATKLSPETRYYLFFGHKGNGSVFRQNNDNTVTLESMLDPRAQAEALKVTGFNEDHTSILNSSEIVGHYRTIVETTVANLEKNMAHARGYVEIHRSFLHPDVKIPLQMSFVLVPADGKGREKQFKVDPFLAHQETEAVAPGDYEASLCALGFKTEPANHPISIQAGKIADVSFTLIPQGMVAGIISAKPTYDDSFWGYLKTISAKVEIRSVHLSGAGIARKLEMAKSMSDMEELRNFLASKDFLSKNGFVFFDLPEGDYTLSIEADGCEPYTTTVKAQPGNFVAPPPYRLKAK